MFQNTSEHLQIFSTCHTCVLYTTLLICWHLKDVLTESPNFNSGNVFQGSRNLLKKSKSRLGVSWGLVGASGFCLWRVGFPGCYFEWCLFLVRVYHLPLLWESKLQWDHQCVPRVVAQRWRTSLQHIFATVFTTIKIELLKDALSKFNMCALKIIPKSSIGHLNSIKN